MLVPNENMHVLQIMSSTRQGKQPSPKTSGHNGPVAGFNKELWTYSNMMRRLKTPEKQYDQGGHCGYMGGSDSSTFSQGYGSGTDGGGIQYGPITRH